MSVNIQVRRGTAAAWTAANPTLAQGELGLETDTGKIKAGDGATAWASLSYFTAIPTGAAGGDLSGTYANPSIAARAVTYAKIQAVSATSRLLGRVTAGSGDIEELTTTQVKTLLAIAASDVSGLAAIATSGSATDLGAGTVPAARMPAHTGDATSTVGTVALTIAARAVTYAKFQAVSATSRILGRTTAGAGDVEELTATQAKAILAIAASDVSGLATVATSGSASDLGAGTLPAGRFPALTGDVTTVAGALAATIAARAVTYAKIQAMATSRIHGRVTAGSGDIEELTAAQVKTLLAIAQADVSGLTTADSPTLTALTLSNGQIVFPAAQNSAAGANTFDDYEEGTFTPVLAFATPGNSTWAVTTQLGWYTKIGNVVIYTLFLNEVPTNGTASGLLTVTGMPFTAKGTTNEHHQAAISIQGYTKAGYTMVGLQMQQGGTVAQFAASGTGVNTANLGVADIPTGGTVAVRASGIYLTAT